MYHILSVFFVVIFFIMLLFFPSASIEGASAGLLLWYQKVLPVLLPFALASHLIIETNLTEKLPAPWYAVLAGFLCGYPMGALITGELTRSGKITMDTGNRLLMFCNQPSPMFLTGYLGLQCLGRSDPFPLLLSAYLPPAILGAFQLLRMEKKENQPSNGFRPLTASIFEKAWFESCRVILKVGGYILLFSIIAAWLNLILENNLILRPVIIGFFEMTTGSGLLNQTGLPIRIQASVGMFLVSFGGLSCLAQTAGCLTKSHLKMGPYIASKLLCGFCSSILCYILIR